MSNAFGTDILHTMTDSSARGTYGKWRSLAREIRQNTWFSDSTLSGKNGEGEKEDEGTKMTSLTHGT
jgi:hypothetical protein